MIQMAWWLYRGFLEWLYEYIYLGITEFERPKHVLTPIVALIITLLLIFALTCILY